MAARRDLWSRAETVLALELAMAAPGRVDEADPAIQALSRALRGGCTDPRYRNPYGVACKVRRLAAALAGGRVLRGGAAMEALICKEFAGRPGALAAEAAAAREGLGADFAVPPSRGPVPSFGEVLASRSDSRTFVYLACLSGVTLADGRLLAKVGRSVNVSRRMGELNAGFPAPLGLRWLLMAKWRYRDGGSAHTAEQAMLARLAAAGCSVGGEFVATDANGLDDIAAAGPDINAQSCLRPRTNAPVSRDRRPARRRRRARRQG